MTHQSEASIAMEVSPPNQVSTSLIAHMLHNMASCGFGDYTVPIKKIFSMALPPCQTTLLPIPTPYMNQYRCQLPYVSQGRGNYRAYLSPLPQSNLLEEYRNPNTTHHLYISLASILRILILCLHHHTLTGQTYFRS